MGFNMLFNIIFGTNLLTEGPVQIAIFFSYFIVSQMEQNLREDLSWNKRNPWDLEWKSETQRGGHEAGWHAPTLVGPS